MSEKKFNIEDLKQCSCEALAQYCKKYGIVHYHGKNRFRKDEMIEAILKAQKPVDESTKYEEKIEEASVVVKEKETTGTEVDENKEKYLSQINLGTLVAFRENSGKLNTAAVMNVSYKRQQLRLETQYGKEFIVNFSDVVWIRTKKRWPRFVLEELKNRGAKV